MKNKIRDYQWPSSFIKTKSFINKNLQINNGYKLKKIENFFKDRLYNYDLFLFPSARASIAVVLRYLKINRSDEVFVNKWVSHCIFNTVGAYTNISTNFSKPKLSILVHKWGKIQKLRNKKKIHIIEDSVDSIIYNKSSLFINNGNFEILSLPKIIGIISGGIIITKDKKFKKFCKLEQKKNQELGKYQSFQKFMDISKKKNFNTWLYHESWNTYMERNSLDDIISCLKNYEINKRLILQRIKYLNQKFRFNIFNKGRLGPVVPIPPKLIKNKKLMEKNFMLRHINKNEYSLSIYQKVFILPIHFKIKNSTFYKYVKILEKSLIQNEKKINIF